MMMRRREAPAVNGRELQYFKYDMNYTVWQDEAAGLTATTSMPVIYIHSFRGNGEDVWQACREMPGCPPVVLVSVNNPGGGLDNELSPWPAPAVWKGQAPYKGQATAHLKWMTEECMPEVEGRLKAMGILQQIPMIAGYSLAGLFALWAGWTSGNFARVASVSGSLWYPGFTDFIRNNAPAGHIGKVCISLGDRESHTRHPLMSQVDTCTAAVVDAVKTRGIDTVFEWNPGNHFDHPERRMARAIAEMVR